MQLPKFPKLKIIKVKLLIQTTESINRCMYNKLDIRLSSGMISHVEQINFIVVQIDYLGKGDSNTAPVTGRQTLR